MFKLTGRSGLRRSSGAAAQPRVGGIPTGIAGSDITLSQRRKPAFVPDIPEEQTFDSDTGRVSEPGETVEGYTGKNIGA